MIIPILFCVVLVLAGAIAASSLIIAKKPNAAELIAKIAPIQGILGIILLVFGVLGLINILRTPIGLVSVMGLVSTADSLGLGFLLAFSLFGAKPGGDAAKLNAKLNTYRVPLGVVGIVLGLLYLILLIIH